MKLPRDLSGADLIGVLCKHYGYQIVHQEDSHVILQTESPVHHRIAVPRHDFLRIRNVELDITSSASAQAIDKREILKFL
jgi:predicted RNA binding protein YcfA (HicA-like mRNA interferase family)